MHDSVLSSVSLCFPFGINKVSIYLPVLLRDETEQRVKPFEPCFFVFLLSLEQLGFNALLQLMIGVPLEMVHGILRISLLYMAGVLAGECLVRILLSKPLVPKLEAAEHC